MERRRAGARVYICVGGVVGTTTLPESWTDRGQPPESQRLTVEMLADLARIIMAITIVEG
jgi:hypothetical protein